MEAKRPDNALENEIYKKAIKSSILSLIAAKDAILKASDSEVWEAREAVIEIIDQVAEKKLSLREMLPSQSYGAFLAFFKELHEESRVRKARIDPDAFMEYVFQDDTSEEELEQSDMHQEWQASMGKFKQTMIVAPRGHGKSTQVSIGRPLWELGRDPNKRIKIISNTDAEAAKRVSAMQKHILENKKLHRVFPHLKPADQARWTGQRFFVKRTSLALDPSVEAYGVFSSGTGGRCDILVLDDVVDRKNALTQPGLREQVKEAVLSDWLALLSDDGWAVYICTLWHKKDLSHEIGGDALSAFLKGYKPDQSGASEGKWFVSFHAVGDNFESVWEKKWPTKKLIEKYNQVGRLAFKRGWQNKATDDVDPIIDQDWIKYFSPTQRPELANLLIIQSYDLALSTKPSDKNSFFTCVTAGIDFSEEAPKVYVLDAFQKRCKFTEQISTLKAGYKRIKPTVILVESIYYQAALSEFLIETTILPIIPIKPSVSKKLRLEACSPMFQGGHVLFADKLDPRKNARVQVRGDLVEQITDFPHSEHDDMMDALTQLLQYVQRHAEELAQLQSKGYTGGSGRAYTIDAEA